VVRATLRVRTWEITNAVDSRGHFVLNKHVLIGISHFKIKNNSRETEVIQGYVTDFLKGNSH
jgi:hypothetical protein